MTDQQKAPAVTTSSKQGNINIKDVLKGLLVAVITPVFTVLYSSLSAGSLTFDWKAIGTTAGAAGLAYIMKNWLTPTQTVITGLQPGQTTTVTIPEPGKSIAVPPKGQDPVNATIAK